MRSQGCIRRRRRTPIPGLWIRTPSLPPGCQGQTSKTRAGLTGSQQTDGIAVASMDAYVRKVMLATTAMLPHFIFDVQFLAFNGSSGPSQSTMFGSTGSSSFASASFLLDVDPLRLSAAKSASKSTSLPCSEAAGDFSCRYDVFDESHSKHEAVGDPGADPGFLGVVEGPTPDLFAVTRSVLAEWAPGAVAGVTSCDAVDGTT